MEVIAHSGAHTHNSVSHLRGHPGAKVLFTHRRVAELLHSHGVTDLIRQDLGHLLPGQVFWSVDCQGPVSVPMGVQQRECGDLGNVARGDPAQRLIEWQNRLQLPLTHTFEVHQ